MKRMIQLSKESIDKVFEDATQQGDYVIGLHRLAIEGFDQCEAIQGRPLVSEKTWEYIARKAMDFDTLHHPGVLAGGCWLNYGFSGTKEMRDWCVDIRAVNVVFQALAAV